MPLNQNQRVAIRSLLRRASEQITDAMGIADAASEQRMVLSLKQLRQNVADEIADLDRETAIAGERKA
jgi:hypothetical protein